MPDADTWAIAVSVTTIRHTRCPPSVLARRPGSQADNQRLTRLLATCRHVCCLLGGFVGNQAKCSPGRLKSSATAAGAATRSSNRPPWSLTRGQTRTTSRWRPASWSGALNSQHTYVPRSSQLASTSHFFSTAQICSRLVRGSTRKAMLASCTVTEIKMCLCMGRKVCGAKSILTMGM